MKMSGVDRGMVKLRLRRAQRLKNRDRRLLGVVADRSLAHELANLFEPTARFMNVLVRVSIDVRCGRPRPQRVGSVRMLVAMTALLLRRSMLMVCIMTPVHVMVVHRFGLTPRT